MVDERAAIWAAIQRSNTAWTSGRPGDTAGLFADDAVMVAPGVTGVVEGRDAIVDSYREYAAAAETHAFEETAHDVRIFGETAVVTYLFTVEYSIDGDRLAERGQETLVLRRAGEAWRVVWRTQASLPPAG